MRPDPRGPHRTIKSVESTPQAHVLVYEECGHTGQVTRHFMAPKVGEQNRCYECGPYRTAQRAAEQNEQ